MRSPRRKSRGRSFRRVARRRNPADESLDRELALKWIASLAILDIGTDAEDKEIAAKRLKRLAGINPQMTDRLARIYGRPIAAADGNANWRQGLEDFGVTLADLGLAPAPAPPKPQRDRATQAGSAAAGTVDEQRVQRALKLLSKVEKQKRKLLLAKKPWLRQYPTAKTREQAERMADRERRAAELARQVRKGNMRSAGLARKTRLDRAPDETIAATAAGLLIWNSGSAESQIAILYVLGKVREVRKSVEDVMIAAKAWYAEKPKRAGKYPLYRARGSGEATVVEKNA